ncbi:DUF1015 domain-containing protein, partial [Oscillospiraceae bacterium OttesenSCG-928-F05]|nr:DUF1015 domain-containing protein [Oscillospiraceae bacterium OttesenSCG-928-F05]
FYIYEEEFTAYGRRMKIKGLIGRVRLEPFENKVVLPHEETLSKAKNDRLALMEATHCNFSQIYSLYHDDTQMVTSRLSALADRAPEVEFSGDDGIIHRLWTVTDPAETAALSAAFEGKQLFIADGHHRYETALNFHRAHPEFPEAQDVMMMLVDMADDGLCVFPTHRLVKNLEHFDLDAVLNRCEAHFSITPLAPEAAVETALSGKTSALAFVTKDRRFLLELRDTEALRAALPDKSEAYRSLDVALLHTLLLEPVFGIDKANMMQQINLEYTRDEAFALESVLSGRCDCAFFLNPTRVDQIQGVSLAGEKMPQKSTYFYPKLITGLVMNQFA